MCVFTIMFIYIYIYTQIDRALDGFCSDRTGLIRTLQQFFAGGRGICLRFYGFWPGACKALVCFFFVFIGSFRPLLLVLSWLRHLAVYVEI